MLWPDLSQHDARLIVAEDLLQSPFLAVVMGRQSRVLVQLLTRAGFRRFHHGDFGLMLEGDTGTSMREALHRLRDLGGDHVPLAEAGFPDIYPQFHQRWQNGADAPADARGLYETLHHVFEDAAPLEPAVVDAGTGGPGGIQPVAGELAGSRAPGDRAELSGGADAGASRDVPGTSRRARPRARPGQAAEPDRSLEAGTGGTRPEPGEAAQGRSGRLDPHRAAAPLAAALPAPDPMSVAAPRAPRRRYAVPEAALPAVPASPFPSNSAANDDGAPAPVGLATPPSVETAPASPAEASAARLIEAPPVPPEQGLPPGPSETPAPPPGAEVSPPRADLPLEASPAPDVPSESTPPLPAPVESAPTQVVASAADAPADDGEATASAAPPVSDPVGDGSPLPPTDEVRAVETATQPGQSDTPPPDDGPNEEDPSAAAERRRQEWRQLRLRLFEDRMALRAAPPSAEALQGFEAPKTLAERVEASIQSARLVASIAAERMSADSRGEIFNPDLTPEQRRLLASATNDFRSGRLEAGERLGDLQLLAQHFVRQARQWNPEAVFEPGNVELRRYGKSEFEALTPSDVYGALHRLEALTTSTCTDGFARALWSMAQRLGFSEGKVLLPNSGNGVLARHKPAGAVVTQVPNDPVGFEIARALHPEDAVIEGAYSCTVLPARFYDVTIAVSHDTPDRATSVGGGRYVQDEAINIEPDTPPLTRAEHLIYKSMQKVRAGGVGLFAVRQDGLSLSRLGLYSAITHIARHSEIISVTALSSQLIHGHCQMGEVVAGDNDFQRNAALRTASDTEAMVLVLRRRERPLEAGEALAHAELALGGLRRQRPLPIGHINAALEVRRQLPRNSDVQHSPQTYDAVYAAALTEERDRLLAAVPEGALTALDVATDPLVPVLAQRAAQPQVDLTAVDGTFEPLPNDAGIGWRDGGRVVRLQMPARTAAMLVGLCGVRDAARRVLQTQMASSDDVPLHDAQRALRHLYDAFVADYGPVSHPTTFEHFSRDAFASSLLQLETYDPERESAEPTAFFTERVVRPQNTIEHTDDPLEAVSISMGRKGCVDPALVSAIVRRPWPELQDELRGAIFMDPLEGRWVTRSQYLSGPVRAKAASAEIAQTIDATIFSNNVEALADAMPADVSADDVDFMFGAPWVPRSDYARFIAQSLGVEPNLAGDAVQIRYIKSSGTFRLDITQALCDPIRWREYSSDLLPADELFKQTLNARSIKVMVDDPDFVERMAAQRAQAEQEGAAPPTGRKRTPKIPQVVDHIETSRAHVMQERIKDEFARWAVDEPLRAERLTRAYNMRVNAFRDREASGEYLRFERCSPLWDPMTHQRSAVARFIEDGGLLIAHGTGTGKTFTQAACAIESVRMGLFNKPGMTTPNATFAQTAAQIIQAYPTARVLLADDLSRSRPEQLRAFVARAAMQNWDLILTTYESMAALQLSLAAQERLLVQALFDLQKEQALANSNAESDPVFGRRGSILNKRLAKVRERITQQGDSADVSMSFDAIGIDLMIVDEAHNFKNVDLSTKMNVLGITSGGSGRARDMELKLQWIRLFNGSMRGAVLATATPICNSIAEVYTMMNLVNPQVLRSMGIRHFDAWATTFGRVKTLIEQKPAGDGFQMRDRFIRFQNVPELVRSLKAVADLRLDDSQTDQRRQRPAMVTHLRSVPRDATEEAFMKSLEVRARMLERPKKDRPWASDSVIVIMGDLRRGMLDLRIVDPEMPSPERSIASEAANEVARIWEESADVRGTQIMFCDQGINGENWTLYREIKQQLVARGIPEKEVALITDFSKPNERHRLIQRFNKGTIRVLLGSSTRIGIGLNPQQRVVAMHHIDMPQRPDQLQQRIGRGQRAGNLNALREGFVLDNFVYAKEGQTRAFEILQNKFAAIQQAFRDPDRAARRLEEEMDVTLENIQVELTDNQLLRQKVMLDNQLKELNLARAAHLRGAMSARQEADDLGARLAHLTEREPLYRQAVDVARGVLGQARERVKEDEAALAHARAEVDRLSTEEGEVSREFRALRDLGESRVRERLLAEQKAASDELAASVPASAEGAAAAAETAPAVAGENVSTPAAAIAPPAEGAADAPPAASTAEQAPQPFELTGDARRAAVRASKAEYERRLAELGIIPAGRSRVMRTLDEESAAGQRRERAIREALSPEENARLDHLINEIARLNGAVRDARAQRDRVERHTPGLLVQGFNPARAHPSELRSTTDLGGHLENAVQDARRAGRFLAARWEGVDIEVEYLPATNVRFNQSSDAYAAFLGAGQQPGTDAPARIPQPSADTAALNLLVEGATLPVGYAHMRVGPIELSAPLTWNNHANGQRVVRLLQRLEEAVDLKYADLDRSRALLQDLERRATTPFAREADLAEAIHQKGRLDLELLQQSALMSLEREAEIMEPVRHMVHRTSGRPVHPEALAEWRPNPSTERIDDAPVDLAQDPDADAPGDPVDELPPPGEAHRAGAPTPP